MSAINSVSIHCAIMVHPCVYSVYSIYCQPWPVHSFTVKIHCMLSLLTIVLIQANSFSQAGRCCHLPLHDGRCPSRHGKMIGPVKCLVFPSQPSTKNSSLRAFRPSKSVQNGAHLPPNPSLNVRRLVSEGFTLAATPMICLRPHVKG